jgi:Fe-S-cluster containining protein
MKDRKIGKNMNKCGNCKTCCEFFMVTLTDVPDEAKEFFKTWGVLMEETGNTTLLKIYSPCQHLTENGCSIYKKRPKYCREFRCNEIEN